MHTQPTQPQFEVALAALIAGAVAPRELAQTAPTNQDDIANADAINAPAE